MRCGREAKLTIFESTLLAVIALQFTALLMSELVFCGVATAWAQSSSSSISSMMTRAVQALQPITEMSVLLGFSAWGAAMHAGRTTPAPLVTALSLGVGMVIAGRTGAGGVRIPGLLLSIGLLVISFLGGTATDLDSVVAIWVCASIGLILAAGCAALLGFARDPAARREALLGWNSALLFSVALAASPALMGKGLSTGELLVVGFLLGAHVIFEMLVSVAEERAGKRKVRARELTLAGRGLHALGLVGWVVMFADVPGTLFRTDPAVGVGGVVLTALSFWLASVPYVRAVPVQRSGDFERLALRLEMGAMASAALALATLLWMNFATLGRTWRWGFAEITTLALLAGVALALAEKSGRIESARFRRGCWLSLTLFLVCCAGMMLGAPHGG